jgi:hypothetical protein
MAIEKVVTDEMALLLAAMLAKKMAWRVFLGEGAAAPAAVSQGAVSAFFSPRRCSPRGFYLSSISSRWAEKERQRWGRLLTMLKTVYCSEKENGHCVSDHAPCNHAPCIILTAFFSEKRIDKFMQKKPKDQYKLVFNQCPS